MTLTLIARPRAGLVANWIRYAANGGFELAVDRPPLATANEAGALHPALLDRFRILEMPDPRTEDLLALLPGVMSAVIERRVARMARVVRPDRARHHRRPLVGRVDTPLTRIVAAILDARDNPQRAN
jgi:hypothetical protein